MRDMNDDRQFYDATAAELNEPARATLEALKKLSETLGDRASEHARMVQMAERGMHKVLRTAERLALLSRLDTGTLATDQTVDLTGTLQEALRESVYLEGRRNITLDSHLHEGEIKVVGDAEAIRLCVGEAVIQAVRSAKKKVVVALELTGNHALLCVEDDGPAASRMPLVDPAVSGEGGARSGAVVSLELAVRIAAALDLTAGSRASQGFCFTLRWPVPR